MGSQAVLQLPKQTTGFITCVGEEVFATLVFKTDNLKRIIKDLDYVKVVNGGDNYASKMYLVSLQKLFSSDVFKAFKDGI